MLKDWHRMGDYYLMTKCPYIRKRPNGFYTPCGKCYFCRKKAAAELAFRAEQEAFDMHVYNCLITYDDEHLPIYIHNGKSYMSLNKVHFQDFMKRLRFHIYKQFKIRLRYIICGEYGGKKGRPHYHLLLFTPIALHGTKLDNLEPFSFLSELLTFTWRKGQCDAELMHGGQGQMVRYMVQYMIATSDEREHIEPPFRLMSRGRGIGHRWLDRNKEFISRAVRYDEHYIKQDGFIVPIPRYYQKKYVPEYQQIARADKYYYDGQEYESYYQNLTRNEKRKYIEELFNYREREQFTARQAYRKAKVHEHDKSASRLFARSAKARKG